MTACVSSLSVWIIVPKSTMYSILSMDLVKTRTGTLGWWRLHWMFRCIASWRNRAEEQGWGTNLWIELRWRAGCRDVLCANDVRTTSITMLPIPNPEARMSPSRFPGDHRVEVLQSALGIDIRGPTLWEFRNTVRGRAGGLGLISGLWKDITKTVKD